MACRFAKVSEEEIKTAFFYPSDLVNTKGPFKARLHWRSLSQQLDAIFVALKVQLQNRRCKPRAICRRDIAGVSNVFET